MARNLLEITKAPMEANLVEQNQEPRNLFDIEAAPVVETGYDPEEYAIPSNIPEYSAFTQEERDAFVERGPIPWDEAAMRSNEWEVLPFAGGVMKGVRIGKLYFAAQRFKKDEYEDPDQKVKDEERLTAYLRKQEEYAIRGMTRGARLYSGLTEMPGFMIEIIATGGLANIGKKAAFKAITKSAQKVAGKTLKKGAARTATRAAARIAATAVGGITGSSVLANRYVPKAGERQIAANVYLTDKGVEVYDKALESPVKSVLLAYGDTAVEYATEIAGGTIIGPGLGAMGKMAKPVVPKIFIRMNRALITKFPKIAAKYDVFTKAGYNGFVEELMEEDLGKVVRPMFGIKEVGDNRDTFTQITDNLFDWEQKTDEMMLFAFPGVTNVAATKVHKYLEQRGYDKRTAQRTTDSLSQKEIESLEQTLEVENNEIIAEGMFRIQNGESVPEVVNQLIRGKYQEYVDNGWLQGPLLSEEVQEFPIESKIKEIQFIDKKKQDLRDLLQDTNIYTSIEQLQEAYATTNLSPEEIANAAEQSGMIVEIKQNAVTSDPSFQAWMKDSKVRGEDGSPTVVYSGHANISLYGKFDPNKATAGAFYSTVNPEIASNYSLGKMGVKESYENGSQYVIKDSDGKQIDLIDIVLTDAQLKILTDLKNWEYDTEGEVRGMQDYDNWVENNSRFDKDAAFAKRNPRSLLAVWRYMESAGYTIAYADSAEYKTPDGEILPQSKDEYAWKKIGKAAGVNYSEMRELPGYEEAIAEYEKKMETAERRPYYERQTKNDFEELMDKLGIKWESREWAQPGVMPVYLNIKNPLVVQDAFPADVMAALEEAAALEPEEAEMEYYDTKWTKGYPLKMWVNDIKEGSEFWATQVPVKAKEILKSFGYDGIHDIGGKMGGEMHDVWIAFDANQITSSITPEAHEAPVKEAAGVKVGDTVDVYEKGLKSGKLVEIKVNEGGQEIFTVLMDGETAPMEMLREGFEISPKGEPATVKGKYDLIKERIAEIERARKDKKITKEALEPQLENLKDMLTYFQDQKQEHKNSIKRYKKINGKEMLREEYNELPTYYRSSTGSTLDDAATQAGFESDMEFRDYLIDLDNQIADTKSAIASIKEQIKGEPEAVIRQREITKLKQRLSDYNQGLRRGEVKTRADVAKYQKEIEQLIKDSKLEAKQVKQLIPMIRNATTPAALSRAIVDFNRRAVVFHAQTAKNQLEKDIKKELKTTKPVKKGMSKVGRYDYETNKFVKEYLDFNKLTKAGAQQLLDAYPEDATKQSDIMKKRMLSLKANGKQSSVAMYEKVLEDIRAIKAAGEKAKSEEDFNKIIDRAYKIDEVLDVIKPKKADRKRIRTKILNWYRQGFTNINSMLISTFDKKTADKYDPQIFEQRRDDAVFYKMREIEEDAQAIFGVEDVSMLHDVLTDMAKQEFQINYKDGTSKDLSKMEIIDIYLSMKNELKTKQYYNTFGKDQIDSLVGYLTPKDIAFADMLQEKIQEYYPVLNRHHINRTGRDLGMVENYWPGTSENEKEFFDDIKVQGEVPSAERQRSLSERIVPIPKSAWDKAQKHIAQAEHTANLSDKYEELKRLFNDSLVKNQIVQKYGQEVFDVLDAQIELLSLNARSKKLDWFSEQFGKAVNNWVVAKIALNPNVLVKQLISIGNYMEDMPVAEWTKRFAKGTLTPKQTFDFMWKNAPFLEARFNRGYSEAINEAIAGAESYNNAWGEWQQFLSSMVRSGDISAIIYGGYPLVMYEMEKNKAAGMSDKGALSAAFETFEKATLKAQQSGLASSRSMLQNDNTPYLRLLLAFKNTPFQYLRKIVDANIMLHNGDISFAQYTKVMTIYGAIQPTLYASAGVMMKHAWMALGNLLTGEDDDENEEFKEELWMAVLIQLAVSPVNAIPVFDDLANYAARKASGKKAWGVFSYSMLDDIEMGVKKLGKKRVTAEDYLIAATSIAEPITMAPIKTWLRIYNLMFGEQRKR